MVAQENRNPARAGKGSLDGLAQRLGALEESLTVVAGELGVSGMPRFKHLDPDAVYGEAVRRALAAIEPVRAMLGEMQAKLAETAQEQAQIRRALADAAGRYAGAGELAGLDDRLAALAARLDATLLPFDRSDGKLDALRENIERLSMRLDTIWERLDAEARAQRERQPTEFSETSLLQRLGALEARIEKIAHAISAPPPIAPGIEIETRLAAFRDELTRAIDRRLGEADRGTGEQEEIAAEVSRQLAALVRDAATSQPAPTVPLLSETPLEKGSDANALVMSAAERAIVRLTHRLEKLEEWRQRQSGEGRARRGVMSRIFES